MKIKLIRASSIITLYNGIYALFYGLFIIIFNKVIISEYFRKIPVIWKVFEESFPFGARLYTSLLLMNAFFLISLGICIIYLSYFILKRKDKLAWAVLFLIGIVGWASWFVINLIMGSWLITILSFIGWASFVIGMVIPLKYYLGKSYPNL